MGISGGWRAARAGGEGAADEGTTRRRRVVGLGVAAAIVAGGAVASAGATSAAALPRLSVSDVVVGEHAGLVQFRVSLSAVSTSPVRVRVSTQAGSAHSNVDYLHIDNVVTIPAGQRSTTVPLEITDDSEIELLETFEVRLSSASNATIANGLATLSIVDNDAEVAVPRIFARSVIVDEKNGTASVPVILGAPAGQASSQSVSVHFATGNGTATAGHDFTGKTGTLTFAPGESVKVVPVAITDDAANEPAETFRLVLTSPTHATLGGGTATVTIGASDRARVAQPAVSIPDTIVGENVGWIDVPITLNAPSSSPVSVRVSTQAGSAHSNVDYEHIDSVVTFAPGQITRPYRIHVTDDHEPEGLETFEVRLSTTPSVANGLATVSVVDNDTIVRSPRIFARPVLVDEKVGTAFVPVLLGGAVGRASNRTVTVHYTTANGTATVAGHDYRAASGTLSFAPGETVKLVPVLVTDDTTREGAERFRLVLSAPVNATIGAATANVTIGASDRPRVALPSVSVADATVGEGIGWIDLALTLNAPSSSPVSVRVSTRAGSAAANIDYEHIDAVVTFAPGETTRPFRVHITDDHDPEGLQTFRVYLSGATRATVARSPATIAITAND
jgi:chitinase